MIGDGDRGGLTPRSLLASANMVRQQSDTTGVRRLVRGVAIEDDRPQTSQNDQLTCLMCECRENSSESRATNLFSSV
ncbi:hypothetical protein ANCDUO_22187 [Ancylostoma duodenale]|uniref:Uncharacterized protein n=1 Tax=Ancylostoma duodenale TaxID=51022 RepID=A0A0C2BUX9_9BILA|nr:hypothetical protein ANCDUO_22187 [Ancylostoma duodenale]